MLHQHLWPDTAAIDSHGHLVVGGCDLVALARAHGTPLYLLDEATFRNSCRAYRDACARHAPGPLAVHYAGKALLNVAVARIVGEEGLGLDVVSGGELHVALRAGFPAPRIHLHGNAKTRAELELALESGVGRVVVDNLDELELIGRLAEGRAAPQPIMLRLAPDVAADTHAHIQTGQATSKFGLPLDALDAAAARALAAPGLRLAGLHAHLGSQIFDAAPFAQALGVLLDCAARLRDRHGIAIEEISPGGGLGVAYVAEQPSPNVESYAAEIGGALAVGCRARGLPPPKLVVEPGRALVARAGVALYEVVGSKPLPADDHRPSATDHRGGEGGDGSGDEMPSSISHPPSSAARYLHVDGGMADNIRPALYGARYTALLANRADAPAEEAVHVAGRYCESGDVLLRDALLPRALPGDLLAVAVAGAYTLSMASTYNLVPRPALLLVGGGQARVIQRRETYDDLLLRDMPL